MTDTTRPTGPSSHGENKMTTVSALRGRRPASVLITILLLVVGYWTGVLPSGSSDTPGPPSTPAATAPAPDHSTLGSPQTRRTELPSQDPSSASPRANNSWPQQPPSSAEESGQLASDPTPGSEQASQRELRYGLLRKVSASDYLSPAGLIYGSGSAQGHRLEHLQRHTVDDPGRSGPHGVFDGGMEGALQTVDLAYERAKAGQRTTVETEDNRTIYTVDLGKRVGYVGGREGQRRRHPMARRVRLVLEGNRVVTAFPL